MTTRTITLEEPKKYQKSWMSRLADRFRSQGKDYDPITQINANAPEANVKEELAQTPSRSFFGKVKDQFVVKEEREKWADRGVQVAAGALVGMSLKSAFQAVAVVSGASALTAVAAAAAVSAKTVYDIGAQHYDNNRQEGQSRALSFKAAAKDIFSDKTDRSMITSAMKKNALFAVGMAIPFSSEILEAGAPIYEKLASTVSEYPLADKAQALKNEVSASVGSFLNTAKNTISGWGSWFTKSQSLQQSAPLPETSAPEKQATQTYHQNYVTKQGPNATMDAYDAYLFGQANGDDITVPYSAGDDLAATDPTSNIDLQGLSPMEKIANLFPDLVGKAVWEIRDFAHEQVWNGDRADGLQIYQLLADSGDKIAMKNMDWFTEHNFVETVSEAEMFASMDLNDQALDIHERAVAGNPQAQNDQAIGLLNGMFGFPEKFALGLEKLDEVASLGHEKSLNDIQTLIDAEMVNIKDLSMETRQHLAIQINGFEAACNRAEETCVFKDGISDERKGDLSHTFAGLNDALPKQNPIIAIGKKAAAQFVANFK